MHVSDVARTGLRAHIQFLIADKLLTTVVEEDDKTWKVDSGRVAKKKSEGKCWVWASDVKPQIAVVVPTPVAACSCGKQVTKASKAELPFCASSVWLRWFTAEECGYMQAA